MNPNSLTPEQKNQLLQRMQMESQQQRTQELINKINESCFSLCAGTRGDSLDTSEKTCLTNCMGSYLETMGLVTQVVSQKGR